MSAGSRTAEIFDPRSETFTPASGLSVERASHTATPLPGGRVLIAGGWARAGVQSSTEVYDPVTGAFTPGPLMAVPRSGHSATLLDNGRVLIAGGYDGRAHLDSAEIFDPRAGVFAPSGRMALDPATAGRTKRRWPRSSIRRHPARGAARACRGYPSPRR